MDSLNENAITSELFFELYKKVDNERVTKIINAPGITIIREYPEKTDYSADGKRIFIKIYFKEGYILGSVDMVQKNEEETFTIITDKGQYKKRFTNFFFGKEENVTFNTKENKFLIRRKNKIHTFNMNSFIDLLVKNHLTDQMFLKRKINKLKVYFLEFLFWLMDSKYDWVKYYDLMHNKELLVDKANSGGFFDFQNLDIEPFFKYFKIYKKILFIFVLIVTFFISYIFGNIESYQCALTNNFCAMFRVEYFNIANPILLFYFFIFLFLMHYFSLFLKRKVEEKEGFIHRLQNSSLNGSFSLKIP